MRERKEAKQGQQKTGADAEFTQYFEGEKVSGGNLAYGNSPRNQGARLTAILPEEERTGQK